MRIGVFGGTFDPIHLGHLSAAQDAASLLGLDRVLFVPNRVPPHKRHRPVSDVADRVTMVDLAIADNQLFAVSLLELEREGPSYTLDTLRELRKQLPGSDIVFLVGCDAVPALPTWNRPDELLKEFEIVVMERPTGRSVDWETVETRFPGIRDRLQVIPVAQLEISSDDIRTRVREQRPIRYLVPAAVERYVSEHGLYEAEPSVGKRPSPVLHQILAENSYSM